MGKRIKTFYINDNNFLEIHFGTYALMMYYAAQIDPIVSKKLFDATLSEWKYRAEYDLPLGTYDDDNGTAHFIPNDLQEVIIFINNEIIPSLEKETQDLLVTYGGRAAFEEIFYQNEQYLQAIGIIDEEYVSAPGAVKLYFIDLRNFFQEALAQNQPYEVYIE